MTIANDMMAIVNGPAPAVPGMAGLVLWVNHAASRANTNLTTIMIGEHMAARQVGA